MKLDKDGLLFSYSVIEKNGRFFIDKYEIYPAPECRGVVEYLLQHPDLWKNSRLRYNLSDIRRKGAPIIGVPFSQAIKQALQNESGLQKSMYEIPDWTRYEGKAVIATMLVHTASSPKLIELEAWQLLDVSDETVYVHCIFDRKTGSVIHLDGATMQHTKNQRNEIRKGATKIKGERYRKNFRLDGKITPHQAVMLMDLYFPIEPLSREFLDCMRD
jgi:hypothetical protein